MNFYIQQSIHINLLKIGGVTNSSVLQIGSAGIIKPSSHLFNTGGFTEPAPEAQAGGIPSPGLLLSPAVPLHPPVRND
ncbi:spore germination protein GerPB [Bacillus sp. REN3]|uniref:spore germination protein GerPB n=1 Tax=Bacillus sp. REN3 TaxID=2802440 RepID=UPI001AEF1DF5|nr:spore germination protein GerPB [Bacillus sp. REN3]